ncbi:metallophosphoesterase family protein [Clostridium aminobutyricum]|uniref:Phosphoesterase n=1 Tax=Clostridium aminobutyricum TaxID=33953 RepID=A0A939D7T1_CLOAM|nr:metallophosphoesterase family protein [Clostridium aminobutyricum]MBN7772323.1 metallophosphoesterase family protein [Clostridium aminobutyricum]
MKKILIISDTHGLLRDEVKAELSASDCIIHAGDMNTPSVLQALNEQGNLFVVRGNNDKEWAENLPKILTIAIEGIQILIVHNKKDVPKDLTDIDVVIYGHSHKYDAKVIDGVLWLNPGSCGKRRFDLEISMCRLYIDQGTYKFEKIVIT